MKERLTGAIILVVLIVLLVPELLSGPKGPAASAPARTASPSFEEPPLRSYTINLGDDSHSPTTATASNGPAMPQPSGPEQPTVQPTAPQPDAPEPAVSSQSPSGTPPSSPTTANPPSGVHSQQSTPESKTAGSGTGQNTVRGEAAKPSRVAAVQKAAKMRSAAANTTASARTGSAKAGAHSESGAWGVQLGVFVSRENAERLAMEVRVKGFKASVSPVSSGSRKLYRVRVGPTPDRSGARELQVKLKAAGRPGGTVIPYS